MACWSKYVSVAGAGLAGAGSGLVIVVGAGTPLTLAGILTAIGSLLLLIAALKDLADCLEKKGKVAEAERMRRRIAALEKEVEELKRLVS